MFHCQALARNVHDYSCKLVDRHHLFRPDVDRAGKRRFHQAAHTFQALGYVEERTGLFAVAPDLDFAAVHGFCHFAADGGRSLLPAVAPGSFRAEDVVKPCDADLDPIVPHVGEVEAFAEEFLPPVLAVWRRWIGGILGAFRVGGVELVVLRVHARGGGIEELLHAGQAAVLQAVQVDGGGVMHDGGIVLPGEDISGPAHIGCKLVDFVDSLDHLADGGLVAQVADDEFVSRGRGEVVRLEIDGANPIAFGFEAFDKVAADEAAGAVDQHFRHSSVHGFPPEFCSCPASTNPVLTQGDRRLPHCRQGHDDGAATVEVFSNALGRRPEVRETRAIAREEPGAGRSRGMPAALVGLTLLSVSAKGAIRGGASVSNSRESFTYSVSDSAMWMVQEFAMWWPLVVWV